jgi:tripartite-type tricarboxylate transporter receptor subunit TctC
VTTNATPYAWILSLALLAGAAALPLRAIATDDYPARPVRIVVPYPAGTVADHFPRIVAEKLAEQWKQPFLLDNRAGASGNIGAEAVSRARPDGHTLLASPPPPLAINQSLFTNLPFDPHAFAAITVLAAVPNVLVANPGVPASSIPELVAYARTNPDRLTYASIGSGSTPHLTTERFKSVAGVRMLHVPYKGSPGAILDLVAGRVDVMFVNHAAVFAHVNDGRLKLIAVASRERLASLPEVPTVSETLPGFVSDTWFALVAPPGTPGAIVDTLSSAIREILRTPEVIARYRQLGATPVGSTPTEARAFLQQESERWAEVIRSARIKPD